MTIAPPSDLSGYPEHLRWTPDIDGPDYPRAVSESDIVDRIYRWIPRTLIPGIKANDDRVIAALVAQTDDNAQKIADALYAIANAQIQITDPAMLAVLNANDSATLGKLRALFQPKNAATGTVLLAGDGIDLAGIADSTVAVKAFFAARNDGDSVVIPTGATIVLTDTITVSKRIRLSGTGLLKWTGGIASKDALAVTADGVVIDTVRMQSVGNAPQPTGDKQSGIAIYSSNVKVLHSFLDGFQQAICVQPFGECYNTLIDGNTVVNVPGSGGGRNSSSSIGEDRGDGIVSWGAQTTIVNNTVALKSGDDGRVGIHTEGLGNLEGNHGPHSSSLARIIGNVVTGQFRRSITVEGVGSCVVADNTVADATGWAIGIVGGDGCTIKGNTVIWTATSADNQWATFSPRRAALSLYGAGGRTVFADNVVTVAPGATLPFGMNIQTDSSGPRADLLVHHNILVDDQSSMYSGINVLGGSPVSGMTIDNNEIRGYNHGGIETYNCDNPIFTNNRMEGRSDNTCLGIVADGNPTGARADNNTLIHHSTAIKLVSRTSPTAIVTAKSNAILAAGIGIDYSSTPSIAAEANTMVGVTTPTKSA